ncbi:MAG: glycosyltransferase family 4 protein [Elusimicrobiales bacterium]|nr:glycosyltransferase family 4 protein [Elusimicrobiales bacterium]
MKKVCFIVSSKQTIQAFLLNHIRELSRSYELYVVANTTDLHFLSRFRIECKMIAVPIQREVSLVNDLVALFSLIRVFCRERFVIIHSVTPKAGLLSMIAGKLCGVPVRVHTFTGQIWATCVGLRRYFFKALDKVLVYSSTHILADSASQREFLIREGVVSKDKSRVLANGSISGVDAKRFKPNSVAAQAVRCLHGIPASDFVFIYVGRFKKDKGLLDLAKAFSRLSAEHPDIWLMLIGPDEENLTPIVKKICGGCVDRVVFTDFVDAPEEYMAAADVFCLPSYREGFGNVIIEAAACGIPSIASRIYGIIDAVADGETGCLYNVGNVCSMLAAMTKMLDAPGLRRQMGDVARNRAIAKYSQKAVTESLIAFYGQILMSLPRS